MDDFCSGGKKNCFLTYFQIDDLAQQTPKEWKRITLYLGIEQTDIDNIAEDGGSVHERACEAYKKWKRTFPEDACHCKVFQALEYVKRNDLVREMKKQMTGTTVQNYERQCTVYHFIDRKEELEIIHKYNKSEKQLLLLIGPPGIGKKSLLCEALAENKYLLEPSFENSKEIDQWLKDYGNRPRYKTNNKTILVLKVADHSYPDERLLPFIYKILRENKQLKIIVTCARDPGEIEVPVDRIFLQALNEESSTELLKEINPNLNCYNCKRIFSVCGGCPFLLHKVASETKHKTLDGKRQNESIEEYLVELSSLPAATVCPLIRKTHWMAVMENTFSSLHDSEKMVLAKLASLDSPIARWSIQYLDINMLRDVEHLYSVGCFVDKTFDGTCYQVKEPYKTFIINYCKNFTNESNALVPWKKASMEYYLKVFVCLKELFSQKKVKHKVNFLIYDFIENYRSNCKTCKCKCRCHQIIILSQVFSRHRNLILKSLLFCIDTEDIDVVLREFFRCIPMLQWLLSHQELISFFNEIHKVILSKEELLTAAQLAVVCAISVFIRIHKGFRNESDIYLTMLNPIITCLLDEEDALLEYAKECLSACRIKRLFLQVRIEVTIKTLEEEVADITDQFQLPFCCRSLLAGIYNKFGLHEKALDIQRKIVKINKKRFGTHPVTARSLYHFAKYYERFHGSNMQKQLEEYYFKAAKMYRKIGVKHSLEFCKCVFAYERYRGKKKRLKTTALSIPDLQSIFCSSESLYEKSKTEKCSDVHCCGKFHVKVLTYMSHNDHVKQMESELRSLEMKLVKSYVFDTLLKKANEIMQKEAGSKWLYHLRRVSLRTMCLLANAVAFWYCNM